MPQFYKQHSYLISLIKLIIFSTCSQYNNYLYYQLSQLKKVLKMSILQNQYQIRIMKGQQVYECTPINVNQINKDSIQRYLNSFDVRQPYTIVYVDADGDEITVECQEDYQVAKTTMVEVEKYISFLVRPDLSYFQRTEIKRQSKISKILQSSLIDQVKKESSTKYSPFNQEKQIKIESAIQQDQQIKKCQNQIAQNQQIQFTLSAHANPIQNQNFQNKQTSQINFQIKQETSQIDAYPNQLNDSPSQNSYQKNQEQTLQENGLEPYYKFVQEKTNAQEQQKQIIELKLIEERIDSEQEPLIKLTKPAQDKSQKAKPQKQKPVKKVAKSPKNQEYMTRQQTLKLIRHQLKKAQLPNYLMEKKIVIDLEYESQKLVDDKEQIQNKKHTEKQVCSVCHKELELPYFINSYKNVKLCVKCQKKDKGSYPLIKIRENSQNKVLFGAPSVVYQADLPTHNITQIPMSKCYSLYLAQMSMQMKIEMRKLSQEALACEKKQKKAKQAKKAKAKKLSNSLNETKQQV